jgi:hypothetical protein
VEGGPAVALFYRKGLGVGGGASKEEDMEKEKDYPDGGFDAYEMWQTLQSLREFAYGEFGDANERVWITRQEARIITDLVWLFMDKVQAIKAKEQCDEK